MARTLSKRQKAEQRTKLINKRVRDLEIMDAKGLSRKKWKFVISPKTFFILKVSGIVAIPVFYFVYSPLLVLVMAFYVSLFFFAFAAEHSLNKSVIKSNHIKISKYDSAIALILIIVSLFGAIFGVSVGRFGRFANTFMMKMMTNLNNFGTLLTGKRVLFGSARHFGFGMGQRPPGFVPNSADFQHMLHNTPNMNWSGGRPHFDLNMSNIPIQFMFSQILSTVCTVLIFTVAILGAFSLVMTIRKIKRFDADINEVIVDGEITILSDEEIERIMSFGEESFVEIS